MTPGAGRSGPPTWPGTLEDAFRTELAANFDDAEIVELGMMIGQYLAFGRLLVLLGRDKAACEIYVPPECAHPFSMRPALC